MVLSERLEAAQAELLKQKAIIEDLRSVLPSFVRLAQEGSLTNAIAALKHTRKELISR